MWNNTELNGVLFHTENDKKKQCKCVKEWEVNTKPSLHHDSNDKGGSDKFEASTCVLNKYCNNKAKLTKA